MTKTAPTHGPLQGISSPVKSCSRKLARRGSQLLIGWLLRFEKENGGVIRAGAKQAFVIVPRECAATCMLASPRLRFFRERKLP